MTMPGSLDRSAPRPSWTWRVTALAAVGAARVLNRLGAHRMRRVLAMARRGARPATQAHARTARDAVVAVSAICAGEGCVQRSVATALLCRMRGRWPTWCVGVRTQPFIAHAWVEAGGEPVGEAFEPGYYHRVMTVAPVR